MRVFQKIIDVEMLGEGVDNGIFMLAPPRLAAGTRETNPIEHVEKSLII